MQVFSVPGASGSTPLRLATSTKARNIKIISKHVLGFNSTLKVHYGKLIIT